MRCSCLLVYGAVFLLSGASGTFAQTEAKKASWKKRVDGSKSEYLQVHKAVVFFTGEMKSCESK